MALSSDRVQKRINSEAIEQLAARLSINTSDALNLLAKYQPQLVDKASSTGVIDKKADNRLYSVAQLRHSPHQSGMAQQYVLHNPQVNSQHL